MIQRIKKHKGITALLVILLLLIVYVFGVLAPFMRYKTISQETIESTDIVERVYDNDNALERAMILESNGSAWEERIRLLSMAQDEIILSTFDMREGKSTTDLCAVLLKKAEEGVKISLLVDGMNGWYRMHDSTFFYALTSHENVELRLYNPINLMAPWTTQGRMHDKYVIVDDLGYILGGRNTFDYFIGDYRVNGKSYDREVLLYNTAHGMIEDGTSLAQLKSYFNEVWNSKYCKTYWSDASYAENEDVKQQIESLKKHYETLREEHAELFETFDYTTVTKEADSVQLISGDIGIYGKEPKVLYQLSLLMNEAKNKVMIHTPYAVCNDYMYEVLQQTAENVKDVSMMINSIENGDNFFASSDYRINKGEVLKTGITIYEYDGGLSYHGKSIVIDDDVSIIGSFNYDLRSVYMDTELMVAIRSKELTKELTSNMETLQKDCRTVINETEYITPEHIKVEEVSADKMWAMKIVGRIGQKVRYLF